MGDELKNIDLTPAQRKIIAGLLKRYIPQTEVWAYGSRVKWTSKPQSDLDMVAFAAPEQKNSIHDLKEAFEESSLPFRVDLFIWNEIPEQFHKNIESERVGLQRGKDERVIGCEWSEILLKDACSKIGSGATPRGGNSIYLSEGEFSLIRSQNVHNNSFHHNGLAFIEKRHADKLSNVTVEEKDVLLNITGDSVARCCQVNPNVLPARVNQHVAIIRPISTILDAQFLRYYFVSPMMQNEMLSMAGIGATRNALTKGMIENFVIPIPPLSEQKAIAHILGSLDDKIELNRRINATLEGMAQALFKSWFVDFDPVIDNALAAGNPIPEELAKRAKIRRQALADGAANREAAKQFPAAFQLTEELGWIPEGWGTGKINNLAELNSESWSNRSHPEHIKYVDLANTKNGRINEVFPYDYSDAPSRARRVLREDDTIIGTVRPGNRSFAYIHEVGLTGSTGFAVLRPKRTNFRIFIYLCLTQDKVIENFAHLADGGAYPAIRPEVVGNREIVIFDSDLMAFFDQQCYPLIAKIGRHQQETESLAKLRDTLLPKLISGEIRIPEVEKLTKEAQV
jgi:type I restriction enzyme, S subunit